MIAAVVLLNAGIATATERRAERTILGLSNYLHQPVSIVRAGVRLAVDPGAMVPGDLLLLERGTLVPADARLIDCDDLTHADNATLALDAARLTRDGAAADAGACSVVRRLFEVAALCNEAIVRPLGETFQVEGTPTESALVEGALAFAVDVAEIRLSARVLVPAGRGDGRKRVSTLHGFRNDTAGTVKLLVIAQPGVQAAEMFRHFDRAARKAPLAPSDIVAIAAEYGVQFG